MIKFLGLYHAKTDNYIPYEYFIEGYKRDLEFDISKQENGLYELNDIKQPQPLRQIEIYRYKFRDLLISEDFEVIYDIPNDLDQKFWEDIKHELNKNIGVERSRTTDKLYKIATNKISEIRKLEHIKFKMYRGY